MLDTPRPALRRTAASVLLVELLALARRLPDLGEVVPLEVGVARCPRRRYTHECTRSARVLTSRTVKPPPQSWPTRSIGPCACDLLELADEPRDVLLLRRAEAGRARATEARGAAARPRRRGCRWLRSASQIAGVSGTPWTKTAGMAISFVERSARGAVEQPAGGAAEEQRHRLVVERQARAPR